jgi:hypothetical protein
MLLSLRYFKHVPLPRLVVKLLRVACHHCSRLNVRSMAAEYNVAHLILKFRIIYSEKTAWGDLTRATFRDSPVM